MQVIQLLEINNIATEQFTPEVLELTFEECKEQNLLDYKFETLCSEHINCEEKKKRDELYNSLKFPKMLLYKEDQSLFDNSEYSTKCYLFKHQMERNYRSIKELFEGIDNRCMLCHLDDKKFIDKLPIQIFNDFMFLKNDGEHTFRNWINEIASNSLSNPHFSALSIMGNRWLSNYIFIQFVSDCFNKEIHNKRKKYVESINNTIIYVNWNSSEKFGFLVDKAKLDLFEFVNETRSTALYSISDEIDLQYFIENKELEVRDYSSIRYPCFINVGNSLSETDHKFSYFYNIKDFPLIINANSFIETSTLMKEKLIKDERACFICLLDPNELDTFEVVINTCCKSYACKGCYKNLIDKKYECKYKCSICKQKITPEYQFRELYNELNLEEYRELLQKEHRERRFIEFFNE